MVDITPSKINEFKESIKYQDVMRKRQEKDPKNPDKLVYVKRKEVMQRSNSTINKHIEALSKTFNLCIAEGLLKENPCRQVKKLREENFKIRFLTKDEEARLFAVLNRRETVLDKYTRKYKEVQPHKHLEPLFICALQTGMRKGEIFNLKWRDIDFKTKHIEVLKTKSGESRKIPISDKLMDVFYNLPRDSEYVSPSPITQKPYDNISTSFKTIMRLADIENFRFHDLRHTIAIRMVEKGIDLVVVKELLGHSKIDTTMRYAHPVPERKKAAILALNDY